MPTAFTKKLGKRGEHYWNKAKGVVDKEYGVSHKSDRYWSLVTGIAKKMAGKDESAISEIADLLVAGCDFTTLVEDGIRRETRPWNLTRVKKSDPKGDDAPVNPDDPATDDDDDDDDDA